MPTDTSEKGLETRTINLLQDSGWLPGDNQDYDAAGCVDLAHLAAFLQNTQPETAQALHLSTDDNTRRQFLQRLHRQIRDRGIIDVLRNGVQHQQHSVRLFYGTPSPGNQEAADLNALNRFSVTRQVHYSAKNPGLSLDLVLFINGLPIITFELKNNLTKQTVEDAVEQYKRDRDPQEGIFRLGRCAAHMAVDENRVRFCTELAGPKSIFLPFDRGNDGGAGNRPNPRVSAPTTSGWKPSRPKASQTSLRIMRRRSRASSYGPVTINWRLCAGSSRTCRPTAPDSATSSSTQPAAASPTRLPG